MEFVELNWAGLHWTTGRAELVWIGLLVIEFDRVTPRWVELDSMCVCLDLVDMG